MSRRSVAATLVAALALATLAAPAVGQGHVVDACPEGAAETDFSDVIIGSTHDAAIRCGVLRGLVHGVAANSFDPAGAVTRGQFASLLARTLDELDLPLPPAAGAERFADAGATHGEAIARLAAGGIVSGRADGSFGPGDPINRAQMASLLVRTWSFVRGEAVVPTTEARFDDIGDGVHAANIEAAAQLGLLLGRSLDTFDPSATTRRDQAVTAVIRVLGAAPAQLVGEVWSLDQGTDRIHVYAGSNSTELITIDVSPAALQAAGFAATPTGARTVPHMIEFDSQERYAFIASTAGAVTIVIDARSKEVVEVLATGGGSHMAAVTPDDAAVWVAAIGAQQMVEIPLDLDADEPTFTVGRRLDVADLLADVEADNGWDFPSDSPVCHQYSTDSSEAWVTLGPGWNQGGFFVLDLASGTVSDAWDPQVVKANCGISVNDDQVLANWSGQVVAGDNTPGEWYVFDADTKELLDTRSAEGNDAHGLRLTPDGSAYWMVNRESSNAIVVDADTLEVTARYDDVAVTPDILDYSADGSKVYISQRGPSPRSGAIHAASGAEPGVRVVDAATGAFIELLAPPTVTAEVDGVDVVQNDVHGVALRIRGDGQPVGDAG